MTAAMDDLYSMKVQVEGLPETRVQIENLNKLLAGIGSDTSGVSRMVKMQSELQKSIAGLDIAATRLGGITDRIATTSQQMMSALTVQAKATEKAFDGVNKSSKQFLQNKFKNNAFTDYLADIKRLGQGFEMSESKLRGLLKQATNFDSVMKDIRKNPAHAAAFRQMFGSDAERYLQNNAMFKEYNLINSKLAEKVTQQMQKASDVNARNLALESNKSHLYSDQIEKLQKMLRLNQGGTESLRTQIRNLKQIEAEYQRILAMPAAQRAGGWRQFNKQFGSEASASGASTARQLLINQATAEYSNRLKEAHRTVLLTNNAATKLHGIWRGIAASTGNLWLSWGQFHTMAAGLAVGGSVFKSLTLGKDLGWQMELVGVAAETGRRNVSTLRDEVLALGAQGSLYGPIQLASSLRVLAQAGLKTREALAMLPTTLNLSLVAEVDTEKSALFLAGLRSAFNLEDNQVAQAADQTAKAAAESQTSIEAMMESMKQASSEASKFGLSVSDTSTALALLARVNITGSAAGTAVKNLLTDLAGRTQKSQKALAALGISAYNSAGMVKPFSELIAELQQRFQGMTDQQKQGWMRSFLNERGMRAANVLLNTSNEEFERLRKNIDRAGENMGYTNSQAQLLAKTTEGMFRTMKASWQTTFASNGVSTEGQFQALLASVTALSNAPEVKSSLNLLTKLFLGVGQGLIGMTHAASLVLPVMMPVAAFVGTALVVQLAAAAKAAVVAGTATGVLTKGIVAVRTALLTLVATPAGVILGGLAAGATAAYLIWDRMQDKIADVKSELAGIPAAAGAVSNEVYEAFNTSGTGFDIDKRLGIGVSIDKLNQLAGTAGLISKEFELAQAKTAQDFQSNLSKIMAVTTDEAAKSTERMKSLANIASTHELEQRVLVKDRTKSILTEQLKKFDQHYAGVKELSKEQYAVRVSLEESIHKITTELMTARTQLAVQQMRETASEAIRQQSRVSSVLGAMWRDLTNSGSPESMSANRLHAALRNGQDEGLLPTEKKAYQIILDRGDLTERGVNAAMVDAGLIYDESTHKARYNSYRSRSQVETWQAMAQADPQRAATNSQRNLEEYNAALEWMRASGIPDKEKYDRLRISASVEQVRLAEAQRLLATQEGTKRKRDAAEIALLDGDDPPTKSGKASTPQDYSGRKAIDIQKTALERQFSALEAQRKQSIALTGIVPEYLSQQLVEVGDKLDALSEAAEAESRRLELNKAQKYLAGGKGSAEGKSIAEASLKALTSLYSGRITSGFGMRTMGGERGFHNGIDIAMPVGTSLKAPESGRVVRTWDDARGGKQLQFLGDSGKTYGMAHLSEQIAKVDQRLDAGALLAKSGNTGRSTGPHLHLTVTSNGKKIDPRTVKAGGNTTVANLYADDLLGDMAGESGGKGAAARKQAAEDAYLATAKEADATQRVLAQRQHVIAVQETLGQLSARERQEQEHALNIERMKLETKLKVAELMAKGEVNEANKVQLDGDANIVRTQEAYEAARQAQTDWRVGLKTSYTRLVDESMNYGTFAASAFDSVTGTMITAMQNLAVTGKLNFREMTSSILADLAKIAMRMAMLKLIDTAVSAWSGSSGVSAGGGLSGSISTQSIPITKASAKGNVFGPEGHLTTYARGGVVNSPTGFRHAGGRGLMGENGAEGVLPLSRMANGDLGVQAVGGGGGSYINSPVSVSVTVNSDGSGDSEVNAQSFGKTLAASVRQVVNEEIAKATRPGGLLAARG